MEVLLAIGFIIVAVYMLWILTKALMKTLLVAAILIAGGYFALPYFTKDNQLPFLNRLTEKGNEIVDDTIEGAKSLTQDHLVEPLKESMEPVQQLQDTLNSEKNQKKRGID